MRCILLLLLSAFAAGAVPMPPDILMIMPDQMRGDCLSAVGHPVVRTPQLDELARSGVLFRRAYSTCPSCIPARYALLTGLYPDASGVVGYKAIPIKHPTLPQLLTDAGYSTYLVGRYMHQVPKEDSYGYQTEIRGSVYVADDDYDTFLRKAAPETGGIRKLIDQMGVTLNRWQAKPWPLAENLHPIEWTVMESRQVLRAVATNHPLFLTASFYSPHPPLFPLPRYFDHYMGEKLPAPAHGDWVDWAALLPEGNRQGDRVLLQGDILRAALSGYFGNIEQLDHAIGPLIADFETRSEKAGRPWVILFTSDHGEMLGDNGYFRKCEPYEGSANIPFIIAGSPGLKFKTGLQSPLLVSLEDILPTLLDLAGAKTPSPVSGQSLVPALRGRKKALRTVLHLEHAPCYNRPQGFQCLTDERYKYIWRPLNGGDQLFDLKNDPHEEHDLTPDPAARAEVEKWRNAMIKVLAGRPEGFSDGKKLIAGQLYPPIQGEKKEAPAGRD